MASTQAPDKIDFKDEYRAVRVREKLYHNDEYHLLMLNVDDPENDYLIASIPAHFVDRSTPAEMNKLFQSMLDNHFRSQSRGFAAGEKEKARALRVLIGVEDEF